MRCLAWKLVCGAPQPIPASLTLSHCQDPVDAMQSLHRVTPDVLVLLGTAQDEVPQQLPHELLGLFLYGAIAVPAFTVSRRALRNEGKAESLG